MRIVENRVAYIEADAELSPVEHLYGGVNLFNPYLGGLRYDPDDKMLYITCTLDKEHRILDVMLGNLLGTKSVDIVDCQHGVFRGCQAELAEISHCVGMLPQISVEVAVDEIEVWGRNGPDLRAYNISDLPTYMVGRSRRVAQGAPSTGDGKPQKAMPLTWDDVKVHNVSLIMDWSEQFEDLGPHTLSLHLSIRRDGNMSAKQIVVFSESMFDKDPASPEIIENFSGRIRFCEPDADIPYLAAFGMQGGQDDDDEHPIVPVKFRLGRNMEIWMAGPELSDVTYVDAMIRLPKRGGDQDDAESPEADVSDVIRYRLYYGGRIRLGG